jgi:hypothetical protein
MVHIVSHRVPTLDLLATGVSYKNRPFSDTLPDGERKRLKLASEAFVKRRSSGLSQAIFLRCGKRACCGEQPQQFEAPEQSGL